MQANINNLKGDLLKIILANILSQGFLFFLTGTFWDDWFYYYHDRTGLWMEFMEAGRPSSAYWVEAVWNIPHNGYRWLVFFLFMLTSIILYLIISNSDMFDTHEALWLSILYTVIPINDARVILCTFSYTVGLTSFFIGCYVFSKYIKAKVVKKRLYFRIISLIFLGYSFIIQSILMYYAVVLCYILYFEFKNKGKLLNAICAMFRYLDFIILPIAFYIGKQLLFPPYGVRFTNYNSVTVESVLKAAYRLPLAVIRQFQRNWIAIFDFAVPSEVVKFFTILVVVFAVVCIIKWLCSNRDMKIQRCIYVCGVQNPDMQKLILGIIVFAMGLYPYNVVRHTDKVAVVGAYGRDSLLLGSGVAFILYYFFKLLLKNYKIREAVYCILIFCCIVTCNCHYLNWQRDAYWQDVLIDKLRSSEEIYYAENILFLTDDLTGIDGTRFYSLNGAASVAYGNQTRLILTEDSFNLLRDEEEKAIYVASRIAAMNEYDVSNNELDGVIVFDCDINYKECILLKLYELVDEADYHKRIEKMGKFNYYPADSQRATELIKEIGIQ